MVRFKHLLVAAFAASVAAQAQAQTMPAPGSTSDSCATQFPIVLAKGLFAVPHFNVAETLRECGAQVFTTDVDAANTSQVRGAQLLDQIKMILAMTGATKVNLIAHSQGGTDSRFVLGTDPSLLASIVQAGTPNQGSMSADLGLTLGPAAISGLLGDGATALGGMNGTDLNAALTFLSTPGTADFNRQFPLGLPTEDCGQGPAEAAGVKLFSFGGTQVATNAADQSDGVLGLTAIAFAGQPNDGLVGRCSSHFGTVVRDDFKMNHIDLINQVQGAVGGDDPVQVYRMLATQLKELGL